MPRRDAIFDDDFEAATPRASLQILTIVGAALRPHMAALSDADDDESATDWTEVLRTLARVLSEYLPQAERFDEIENVWREFFATALISKAPEEPRRILTEARNASGTLSSSLDDCLELFRTYNKGGHTIARRLISQQELHSPLDLPLATFSIQWDPEGAYYCAATTRTDQRIRWAHQPLSHGLYAALIPDLVFAHEYFSHLSPRHPALSRTITEVWLVFALSRGLSNAADRHWRTVVWGLLREELAGANPSLSAAHELRSHGILGVHELALLLYGRSADAFWKLTRLILALPRTKPAEELDDLMVKMVKDGEMWQKMSDNKWSTFNDLRAMMR